MPLKRPLVFHCQTSLVLNIKYFFVLAGSNEALSPLVIVARPQNVTVVLGHPAVMECMAQGLPKPIVSWSRKGKTHVQVHSKSLLSVLRMMISYTTYNTLLHPYCLLSGSIFKQDCSPITFHSILFQKHTLVLKPNVNNYLDISLKSASESIVLSVF